MEQIVCNINMLFEYFTFFYVIFQKEYCKPNRKKVIVFAICLLVWISTSMIGFDWKKNIVGPFPLFLVWIYTIFWFLFDSSFAEILVLGIGQWLLLSMLESTMYIVLQQLQLEKYVLENVIMLLIACSFWIYYILAKKNNKNTFKLPIKIWCLIDIIMLILTAMMSFFSYVIVQELPNRTTILIGRALSVFGGAIIIILLFVMIYFYNSTYDLRRQKELAEMKNKQQREYFIQLLEREEETRKFRHDIINDLLKMHNYCMNKNCKKMECYLENTLGVIQKISRSSYDVGNDTVNIVLNYYLRPLKEKYSIDIRGYMSEKLAIEERDLCILSANLIKNASEAVKKMDNGNIWINIKEGKEYLCIQVKNTYEGIIEFDKKGIPVTSKMDKKNHGIGMRNIVDIVMRNGGTYCIDVKDSVYRIEIYIKK